MAHVKGQATTLRWPRQPRLVACLAAWAFLASLVALQRSGSSVSNCQRASGGMQEAAAAGGAPAATQLEGAASGVGQPHRQQQQHAADDWPELRGLSRERIEGLIRAPAGLHGRVQKGGLPANYMCVGDEGICTCAVGWPAGWMAANIWHCSRELLGGLWTCGLRFAACHASSSTVAPRHAGAWCVPCPLVSGCCAARCTAVVRLCSFMLPHLLPGPWWATSLPSSLFSSLSNTNVCFLPCLPTCCVLPLRPLHPSRFMMAHLTDTDPRTREEGIPRFFGPMMYQWFAKAFT